MLDLDLAGPELARRARDLVGDHHGAVPAAGAAEGEPESRLFLALVARQRESQERDDVREELSRCRVLQHILADRLVAPGEVAQLRYVERVLHEPDVEDKVRGWWQSVLVAEALHVHEHPALARSVKRVQRVA